MKPPRNAKTRTHFVPRTVYRKAFVGVVPICVAACSSGSSSSGDGGYVSLAVGCSAFGCQGVANFAFDSGSDGVVSGDAADSSPPDAGADAPVLTVACLGFCAGVADAAFDVRDASHDGGESG